VLQTRKCELACPEAEASNLPHVRGRYCWVGGVTFDRWTIARAMVGVGRTKRDQTKGGGTAHGIARPEGDGQQPQARARALHRRVRDAWDRQILKAAGCDFALFDTKHSGFGFETIEAVRGWMEAADRRSVGSPIWMMGQTGLSFRRQGCTAFHQQEG
jgi:hypothetical protein